MQHLQCSKIVQSGACGQALAQSLTAVCRLNYACGLLHAKESWL